MSVFCTESILIGKDSQGHRIVKCKFIADAASDLPAYNAYVSDTNELLSLGSEADTVTDGAKYRLDSSGNWILTQPGQAVYSKSEIDEMIQELNDRIDALIIPSDCPFTCNPDFFVQSQVSETLGGVTYTKSNSGYAIGMVIAVNVAGTGICTGVLYISTIQSAVYYSPYHDYWNPSQGDKAVTYDGGTWYCANPGGASLGDSRASAQYLQVYPDVVEWHTDSITGISENDLISILQYVSAAIR